MTSYTCHVTGILILVSVVLAELPTVRQVSITAESTDDVTITWLPPEPPPDGQVTYEVSCYQRKDPKTIRYSKTTNTTFTLDYPLAKPVDYVTQVRVIGPNDTMSSWTKPIIFRVFESKVPPAPSDVSVTWPHPHQIAITWKSPDFPVSGYRIYHRNVGNDMDVIDSLLNNETVDGYSTEEISRQVSEYMLVNMTPHVSYIVRVQARNVAGEYGPISHGVLAASDVIGGNDTLLIKDVRLRPDITWVDVRWKKPDKMIKYYVITYHGVKRYRDYMNRTETDIEAARAIRAKAQVGNYTIHDMKPFMVYSICIQAMWEGNLGPAVEFVVKTKVGPPPIEGMPIVLQPKEDNSRVLIVSMPKVSDRNGPILFCDLIVVQSVFYDLLTPDEIQYDSEDENNPAVKVPMEYYFIAEKPYITARFNRVPINFELGNWEFFNKFLNKGLKFDTHYRLAFRAYTGRNVHSTTSYSPRFEIHEDHNVVEGSSNDLAGMQLVLFVIADVFLFCMLSALGKLCHTHFSDFCEKREEKREERRRSKIEENGKRLKGFTKSVSLEMT